MTRSDTTQPSNGAEETAQPTHYVLGGAHVGTAIAERLRDRGHRVAVIDESYESQDVPGVTGDPTAVDVLSESGVTSDSTVIVATRSDRRNLLIAQLVRARFDGPRVIVFVHDPERRSLFTDAGHESFCVTTTLSDAVGEVV
ncbi:NAD(P)-binding protein [Halogeometricum luteum]|uniref:NAD-binding protein n=1 Tax=Halogeometricum luteum TaxID=2950537 RepID=A0ABU2FZA3_9EURY|nr:NAD-binding protein [Halogeometricum sp. S3BR5-2]MDS0293334.1 NAD-binding protein [Halogeometricum sp. S3BR5-2]